MPKPAKHSGHFKKQQEEPGVGLLSLVNWLLVCQPVKKSIQVEIKILSSVKIVDTGKVSSILGRKTMHTRKTFVLACLVESCDKSGYLCEPT